MLPIVVFFLILAVISGMLGFTGIQLISIEIARMLFIVFIVLFVFALTAHLLGYRRLPRK